MVSVGTVTAQLLYEIGPPAYLNPDVTSRFDSIHLEQEAPDRVRISGVKGEPPPPTSKVCMNYSGGFATTISMGLTGLDIEDKADLYTRALFANIPGGRDAFDDVQVDLIRTDQENPRSNDAAIATLRVTFYDRDADKVGQGLERRATELGLANYPGLMGMPGGGTKDLGVVWPTTVPSELLAHRVVVGGEATVVDPVLPPAEPQPASVAATPTVAVPGGPTAPTPLGRIVGARSGDKGGNANLGVWVRTAEQYAWLADFLTVARFRELLPDTAHLAVRRYELANILSLNFVVEGILGLGVAASVRNDPQAKGFGEYLRAKVVDVPQCLLGGAGVPAGAGR
jgi:hypothetical protein